MPRAELAITIPESVWIGELSREYPAATFEILTVFPQAEGGVALAEITGPDTGTVVSTMESYEEVRTIDLLQRSEDAALVQFETSEPVLLLPVRNAGTPLELPFTVSDGRVNWEVRAPRSRLSRLADQLREFGIQFDVLSVHQELETNQLLTVKQQELLHTAVESGYYDTPRDCTLTELADIVGIAKSTCRETLHRAEEKVIKQFVEETETTDERAVPLRQ